MDTAERFWAKVVKGPAPEDCWLWSAAVSDDGYGRFTLNAEGRTIAVRPHRFAFHLLHGTELDAFGPLMHTCDVPICVRATADAFTHLVEGTNRSNMFDRLAKGRDCERKFLPLARPCEGTVRGTFSGPERRSPRARLGQASTNNCTPGRRRSRRADAL